MFNRQFKQERLYYMIKFIKAVAAGICISIGCLVNLSCDNKYIGAILFATGLYTICICGFDLFTGKACYSENNKDLGIIWMGNIWGCTITNICAHFTKLESLVPKSNEICLTKVTNESWYSILMLGILCNFMIYFAVEGFKHNHPLLLIFSVAVFILCGFEHCVANMFYLFFSASVLTYSQIGSFLILNTIGNLCGGLIIQAYRNYVLTNNN